MVGLSPLQPPPPSHNKDNKLEFYALEQRGAGGAGGAIKEICWTSHEEVAADEIRDSGGGGGREGHNSCSEDEIPLKGIRVRDDGGLEVV